jgi:hypothetical protein
MATIYQTAELDVPADVAWEWLDRYTRSECHFFDACTDERQEGDYRVVTTIDGQEIWELNVAVDPAHRRASYTIPGLSGSTHHHASMQVFDDGDDTSTLVWVVDMVPDDVIDDEARRRYRELLDDMVKVVNSPPPS